MAGVVLRDAKLFGSIGLSSTVYPATGYVQSARHAGAGALEVNLESSAGSIFVHESRMGPASELAPAWVAEALS